MIPFTFMTWRPFTAEAEDNAIFDLGGEVYKLPIPSTPDVLRLKVGTFTPATSTPDATWPSERLCLAVLAAVPARGPMNAPKLDAAQRLRRLEAVRAMLSTVGSLPAPAPFNDRRTPIVNHLVAVCARAYGLDDASVVDCLKSVGADVTITDVMLSREAGPYEADEAGKSLDAAAELKARESAKAAQAAREAAERAATRKPYTTDDFPGVVLFVRTNDQDTLNYGATPLAPVGRVARALPRAVPVRVLEDTYETMFASRTLGITWPHGPVFDGLRVLGPSDSLDLTLAEAQTIRNAPIFHGQTAMEAFRKARRPSREAMTKDDYVQPATPEFKTAKTQLGEYLDALKPDITIAGIQGGSVLPIAEIGVRGLRLPVDVFAHLLTREFAAADGTPHWLFHQAHWTQLATMAANPGRHLVHPGELLRAPSTLAETVDYYLDALKSAFGTEDKVSRHDVAAVLEKAGASTDDSFITRTMGLLGFGVGRVGKNRKRMFVRGSLDVTPAAHAADPSKHWQAYRSGGNAAGEGMNVSHPEAYRELAQRDEYDDEDDETPANPEAALADIEAKVAEFDARAATTPTDEAAE